MTPNGPAPNRSATATPEREAPPPPILRVVVPVLASDRSIRRIMTRLTAIVVILVVAGIVLRWLELGESVGGAGRLVSHRISALFDLDAEANIPTWFQSGLLLTCAILLYAAATVDRRAGLPRARYWSALSWVFVAMSCEEIVGLHELGGLWLAAHMKQSTAGVYAWLIPGAALVLVLAMVFARFVLRLPARVRLGILLAGGAYVTGELGVEVVEAITENRWLGTMAFVWVAAVQETLEMTGMLVLIGVMLRHLEHSERPEPAA